MPREADIRYVPKCKDLKDAMSFASEKSSQEEKDLAIKIIDNFIKQNEQDNELQ